MDIMRIQAAVVGDLPVNDLTVAERHAFAHEVAKVEVLRAKKPQPTRFVLPAVIERMYRGRSI